MMVSIRFNLLLDFIEGLTVGLGIAFILIGMYCEKYDISKSKTIKRNYSNELQQNNFITYLKRDK